MSLNYEQRNAPAVTSPPTVSLVTPASGPPPPAVPDLDIGVIYTHEDDLIVRLLDTLWRSRDDLRLRLLLVDNASPRGVDAYQPYFPQRLVLRNARQLGYAANLNRILSAATARYVLLLNTDMALEPRVRCLSQMVRYLDAHPRCGLATCRIVHPDQSDGRPARRFPTPWSIACRRLPLGPWGQAIAERHLYSDRDPQGSFTCDWVSGCFLCLRRDAAQQIGPLDEAYGKYFEDVDYCLRAWQAGWEVHYHGSTYCYHEERRASRRVFSSDALRHLAAYARRPRKWGLWTPPLPQQGSVTVLGGDVCETLPTKTSRHAA